MTSGAWRFASASVIGSSHIKTGAPCQDAHKAAVLRGRDAEVFAAALSDGAGSAQFSDVGSRTVCRHLLEATATYVDRTGGATPPTEMEVRTWIGDARAEIYGYAESAGFIARDFACTLLFCILGKNWAVYAQIGDGAMCVPTEVPNEWCWICWPQKGEYANTTRFLTDQNWTEFLTIESHTKCVNEIAMFTDGIENLALVQATMLVHSPFLNGMLPSVRQSEATGADAELNEKLAAFLSSGRVLERTDDDKTLVLASRQPSAVEALSCN